MKSKRTRSKTTSSSLRLDPRNARKHSERNRAAIAKSLETVGAGRGVLADADGIIRAGNGVFEQWQKRGGKIKVVKTTGDTLIVTQRVDLWGKRATQAALLDNLVSDTSAFEYEEDLLRDALASDPISRAIAEQCEELRELLKTEPQAETVDAGELLDRAAELQKKWQVARGDLWEIASQSVPGKAHRILCGDSTNAEDVARVMQGEKARLVWTDPPYGVKYGNKLDDNNPMGYRVRNIQNDDLNDTELETLVRLALKNSADNCVAGAAIYVTAPQGRPLPTLIKSFIDSGFDFRWHLVWLKDRPVLGRGDYHFKHENILYGWKPNGAHYFTESHKESSVFEYPRPTRSDEHPTMKPPALVSAMINNSSRAGEIILDVFIGSGTTLVACEQTGRIGRGIEIEPKYVAVALERMSALGLECRRVASSAS